MRSCSAHQTQVFSVLLAFLFLSGPALRAGGGRLYAESLKSAEHLTAIVSQAQEIVLRSLGGN
jgi:hypothetical protein